MQTFIAALILFVLAFLGLSFGILHGRRRHSCSCKMSAEIMKEKEAACRSCTVEQGERRSGDQRLYDLH